MATEKKNKQKDAKKETGEAAQDQAKILPGGIKQDDLLDMTQGAANMDRLNLPREGVEGRTVSGAGSGPGTGDSDEGFARPGTEGLPAINDFVDPEGLPVTDDGTIRAGGEAIIDRDDLPAGADVEGADASGYPGGGAVRTAEDRLPPGEIDEDAGFSPESPLNR